jgi:hypothetical protein
MSAPAGVWFDMRLLCSITNTDFHRKINMPWIHFYGGKRLNDVYSIKATSDGFDIK